MLSVGDGTLPRHAEPAPGIPDEVPDRVGVALRHQLPISRMESEEIVTGQVQDTAAIGERILDLRDHGGFSGTHLAADQYQFRFLGRMHRRCLRQQAGDDLLAEYPVELLRFDGCDRAVALAGLFHGLLGRSVGLADPRGVASLRHVMRWRFTIRSINASRR